MERSTFMTRRTVYALFSAILLLLMLSGCGGSSASSPPPPVITVSVSPGSVQLIASATQQFTATVTGTTSTAVAWSLSGCTGSACGTVDTNGLYTAPPPIPSADDVTVTVTSQADPSKYASATAHLNPISVKISPSGQVNVVINTTQNFAATLQYDLSTAGVIWSLAASCTPDTCGELSNIANTSVTYTAPSAVPNPATVTLTATSVADSTKTNSVVVKVSASPLILIPGDYAFVFSGWDGALTRQVTLGHFHADANGNVTSGVEDVNDETGVSLSVPITGSYTFNSNHRGTLTLVSAQDNASYSATVDPSGTKGNFIRLFVSGHPISGSGPFELQDNSAFSSAAMAGSYAMELNAKPQDSQTMAAVGRFYGGCKRRSQQRRNGYAGAYSKLQATDARRNRGRPLLHRRTRHRYPHTDSCAGIILRHHAVRLLRRRPPTKSC